MGNAAYTLVTDKRPQSKDTGAEWIDVEDFQLSDSGSTISQPESTEANPQWTATGTALPLTSFSGSFRFSDGQGCSVEAQVLSSTPDEECSSCHFAFVIDLEISTGDPSACSDYSTDLSFAASQGLRIGFFGMDMLLFDGQEWQQVSESIFDHDLSTGSYDLSFPGLGW